MHLLLVVPYVPTLIRVRPYNFVKFLAKRGHQLTLATVWENEAEREQLCEFERLGIQIVAEPLTRNQKLGNVGRAMLSPRPLQADYCWQPRLVTKLDALVAERRFDAVHVEHLRGSRYGLHLKRQLHGRTPVIWDSVDSITHLFEQASHQSQSVKSRLMTSFELPRTRRYEGQLVASFNRVLVTSPVDKTALQNLSDCGPASPIDVVPNGVDLDYFAPRLLNVPREADALVFSGKMSYHANVTAALYLVNTIMPRVWARRPNVTVTIVGKDPAPSVQALAQRHPGRVVVTGMVPDLRDYLHTASVAVVPVVYGAGIQNKVLEAMACGMPVITSEKTTGSLQAGYEDALCVAGDAADFARRVLQLLDNAAERERLGQAARCYVETHHDWRAIAGRLECIYATTAC